MSKLEKKQLQIFNVVCLFLDSRQSNSVARCSSENFPNKFPNIQKTRFDGSIKTFGIWI